MNNFKKNIMKKKHLSIRLYLSVVVVLLIPIGVSAQVTIGSSDPPQATLDIVGNPSETGKAFRMIDGNQSDGKVLTVVGDNGIATWSNVALHIIGEEFNATTASLPFGTYGSGGSTFFDDHSYIDLPPGRYMVLYSVPVWFETTQPNEYVRWRVGLRTKTTPSYGDTYTQTTDLWRANKLQRELKLAFIVNPTNATQRFYIVIHDIVPSITYTGNLIYAPSTYAVEIYAIPLSN